MANGTLTNNLMRTQFAKEAKKSFPTNIIVSLLIGIIIGYFLGTYVIGGVGGEAISQGLCTVGDSRCSGTAVEQCIQTPEGTAWLSPAPDCARLGDFICSNGKCVKP